MKTIRYIAISLFAAIVMAACCDKNLIIPGETPSLQVLIYMAADNNLHADAHHSLDSLRKTLMPQSPHSLLVYIDDNYENTGSSAKLIQFSAGPKGGAPTETIIRDYGLHVNSADKAQLSRVISDARAACPADQYGLILWSHGTGWLPKGAYKDDPASAKAGALGPRCEVPREPWFPFAYNIYDPQYPRVKSFAVDGGDEMEINDLVAALGNHRFQFIAFDACLMGCVEVAYALRKHCDYFMSSPCEILTDGYPYRLLGNHLYGKGGFRESGLVGFAEAFYEYYASMPEYSLFRSATISVVKSNAMDPLATAVKSVVASHYDKIYALPTEGIQVYDRLNTPLFFDLQDFICRVADTDQMKAFNAALGNAVIYKAATPKFITLEIKTYSGLSTYIPRKAYAKLQAGYKTLAWNAATGLVK